MIGCLSLLAASAYGGTIDPAVEELIRQDPRREIAVIVKGIEKAPVKTIRDRDKSRRRSKIIKALKSAAESQRDVGRLLKKERIGKTKQLWIINGIALQANGNVIRELAALPQVESIVLDETVNAPEPSCTSPGPPEWNISMIGAPQVWDLGYTGSGIVVANMDTGVDLTHPDLQERWRGGTNSWFDPHGEHLSPADVNGHGTGTMGVMLGGDAGGTSIGVAPGARWIAVKMFDDAGSASYSDIHLGYQWLLDPDGNPDVDDAPDIVNNSWGLQDPYHSCITEFQPDLEVLKASGIAVPFAAGNDGPASGTSTSPANNPGAFPVGAVDASSGIASFSSRGPSACGGLFPTVVAPGVSILTAGLTFGLPGGYTYVSGTSFSAPHLSGAMALLMSAFPYLDISAMEKAVIDSARDLGAPGVDNDYGYGMLDAFNAYHYLLRSDHIGVYRGGIWYLDKDGSGQWKESADSSATFGIPGDIPVTGNWEGNGTDRIGVFRSGYWFLDLNGNGVWDEGVDAAFSFGIPSDIPVTGTWTAGLADSVGVFREGAWHLDLNGNRTWDEADVFYYFGIPGDLPVTGDWDGSGITKIGVVRGGTWFLDLNGNGTWDEGVDGAYSFGIPGDVPVTGDWNGSGTTKIGVVRGNTWFLDMNGNGTWDDGIDTAYSFGIPGDVAITGDWSGNGITKIGVVRGGGTWFLDMNGNGAWDQGSDVTISGFGISGDIPVTGKW